MKALTGNELTPGNAEGSKLPHVLLVLDQFPKTLGGGERIVLRLAALLPKYGYRVSILTFYIHPQSRVCESAPCPIYLLPLRRTYDLTAVRAALELRRFLRVHDVQIVQTFFESSDLWAGFVTKSTSRARLVWSRRDMGILRSRKHNVAYRLMSGFPDAVLAVSEEVRRHCIEVDRISPSRVATVHNGLDLAHWGVLSKPARPGGGAVVTTVGNIRRVKGHDIFIRAAALIASEFPKVSFSIGGVVLEPEYFEELLTLVSRLQLSSRFTFAGGVTNLQEHLYGADIFVLPSRSEGFSNAIVEAMAATLPVIATDVGGNAEAVQAGITGFIVPPEDPESLAAAVGRLLTDPVMAKRMGDAGREVVLERFTTDAMMNRITSIYATMLANESTAG